MSATETLQKDLYNRIKAKLDQPDDDVYEEQNKLAYKELLDMLKAKYPNTDFDNNSKDKDKSTVDGHENKNDAGKVDDKVKDNLSGDGVVNGNDNGNGKGVVNDNGNGDNNAQMANALDELKKSNTLSDKKAARDRLMALIKTPADLTGEVKKTIRDSYDYEDVDSEKIVQLITENKLKAIIDLGLINGDFTDFKQVSIANDVVTVKLKQKLKNDTYTIKYKMHVTNDGEVIFQSLSGKQQKYLVQKLKGKEELHFVQFDYMLSNFGYGDKDNNDSFGKADQPGYKNK